MIIIGRERIEGSVKPTGNRVLLAPKPAKNVSPGGIHIPDEQPSWVRGQLEWIVLAVGPGEWRVNKKTKIRTFVPLRDIAAGDLVVCDISIKGFPLDDGSGRYLVDSDQCLMSWKEKP